jgi:LPXTG-motif cell wall-anchored protein
VKKNLPTSVAKSLPNTGSGWSFLLLLVLAAGALVVVGGVVLRKIAARRHTERRSMDS